MTENETREAQEAREIEEAGAKRRAAMAERGVESYRSLRVELNDGDDKLERRAEAARDFFSLAASIMPDDRDYEWHEFCELARLRGLAVDKVSCEGLLLTLRANGAVGATGVPPVITKRQRPRIRPDLRPTFTPNGSPDVFADNRRLQRENANLRARLEALTR